MQAPMWITLAILLAIGMALLVYGWCLYYFIIIRKPYRGEFSPGLARRVMPPPAVYESLCPARRAFYDNANAQWRFLLDWGHEDVSIIGHRGKRLKGYLFLAKEPTQRVALAVHGYRNTGLNEFLYIADMYLRTLHMHVLIVDDYAHGASEGKQIGFGWPDRRDCVLWANWLVKRMGKDCELLLHGVSMGAATVINASAEADLPPQVRWMVADCAYASARRQLLRSIGKSVKIATTPALALTSLWNRLLNGYFYAQNEPVRSMAANKLPCLLVHGLEDATVPPAMAEELFAACTSPKELLLVPDACHADAYLGNPTGYCAAVRRLLEKPRLS